MTDELEISDAEMERGMRDVLKRAHTSPAETELIMAQYYKRRESLKALRTAISDNFTESP